MSSEHKKLWVDFFVMFITEFNTKILEAFVKERKVSFSADGHVPCEERLYKLYIENCAK